MYTLDYRSSDTWPWYAIYCQRLKERQAAVALETSFDLSVYLPEVRRRFRGRIQSAPFFPRYLFVRANFRYTAISRINTTPGIVHLVAFDNQPQPIPEAVIDYIRAQVSELNPQGGWTAHHFRPGDTVRLKAGPLRGLEAAFVGPTTPSERVQILIDFLGSLRNVDVRLDDLEEVRTEVAVPLRRERRTRGHGRGIRRHELQ